jgi:hypothetical protein
MVLAPPSLKYQIQKTFAQSLDDTSRKYAGSRIKSSEVLYELTDKLAEGWLALVQDLDSSAEGREEVYQVLAQWVKMPVSLFSQTILVRKLIERFESVWSQDLAEPTECYSVACLLSQMVARARLTLNIDKMAYEELCEVPQANLRKSKLYL